MTPLFVMFMFTILFRWGYVTGRFKWFDGVIQSAGGGERGTKRKKEKKSGKDEEQEKKLRVGALGNLGELKYRLMEPSRTIPGFEVYAYGNVHRQYMLDFSEAYPEVLRSYNSPREMLHNSDLNVLYIGLDPVV